jgi:hypothetical protein
MSELDARITALHLDPGDVLVIRSNVRMTSQQAGRITNQVLDILGDNHPVLIFPPELELMVVRYPLEEGVT